MRKATACSACMGLLLIGFATAKAGDQSGGSLIGKMVIAIRPDAVLHLEPADDAERADFTPSSNPAEVDAEKGEWLGSNPYWIRRRDFIPLSEAIPFFTRQIERSPTAYAYVALSRARRIEKQEIAKALVDAEAAIRLDPAFALAWMSRGECRMEQKRYADAISDFTRALELNPQLCSALSERAEARFEIEDLDGTIADCTAGLNRWPKDFGFAYLRAVAQVQRGQIARGQVRFDLAERDFTNAIDDLCIQRRSRDAKNSGASISESSGDNRDDLDDVIADIYVLRADIRVRHSECNAAIADCNKAIQLGSKKATVYLLRGLALRGLYKPSEAARDFEEAIRLEPNFGSAYIRLSDTLNDLGDHRRAIVRLNQAMRLMGESADLLSARGRAKYSGEEPHAAIQDFYAAIELDPNNADIYNWRGQAYFKLGDHDGAMKDFEHALKLDPLNKYARFNRAQLFYDMGDREKAIADCTSALVSDPNWFQPRYLRGSIYASLGYHREALHDLTRSAALNPTHAPTYMNRAVVWDELNEPEKAIEDLTTVIRIRPDDPRAYRRLAEIFKAAGNKEQATRNFAEAERLEAKKNRKKDEHQVR